MAKAFDSGAMRVKEILKGYLENIRKTVCPEERADLLLYPFAGAAPDGFKFSQAGKMEEAMASKEGWVVLLIILIIITTLAHFSDKWLNRKTFKFYIDLLEKRLAQLDGE